MPSNDPFKGAILIPNVGKEQKRNLSHQLAKHGRIRGQEDEIRDLLNCLL
jgi:hypothetical protein